MSESNNHGLEMIIIALKISHKQKFIDSEFNNSTLNIVSRKGAEVRLILCVRVWKSDLIELESWSHTNRNPLYFFFHVVSCWMDGWMEGRMNGKKEKIEIESERLESCLWCPFRSYSLTGDLKRKWKSPRKIPYRF